jgi:hypothetical protein
MDILLGMPVMLAYSFGILGNINEWNRRGHLSLQLVSKAFSCWTS